MALCENDMIKVHFYDWITGQEIKTENYGKVFDIFKIGGELGIYWRDGEKEFSPFHTFSHSVIFENAESGERYHFSNFKNAVVKEDIK